MGDIFEVDQQTLNLTIAGETESVVVPEGATLRSFSNQHAAAHGIRTFSVYVDGQKGTTEQAGMSLAGVSELEIVPKDSRGSL